MYRLKKYGNFAPLLEEILKRRSEEYDLTDEEIDAEVKLLFKRVNKIQVVPGVLISNGARADGDYYPKTKCIRISQNLLESYNSIEESGQMLFTVLTHEVYHALSHKEDYKMGLASIIQESLSRVNVITNEAFNEAAASRTIYDRTEEEFKSAKLKFSGYQDIAYFPIILATAIGVTEKELLKAGMTNHEKFEEFVQSKFPKDKKLEIKNLINNFENHLEKYHELINDDNLKKDNDKKSLFSYQVKELTRIVYEITKLQIDCSEKIGSLKNGEANFRTLYLNKFLSNFRSPFLKLGLLTQEDISSINNLTIDLKKYIETINNSSENQTDYRDKIIEEDFHGFRKRNDRKLFEETYQIMKSESKKIGFYSIVAVGKFWVNKIFKRRVLPPARKDVREFGNKKKNELIHIGEIKYKPQESQTKKQDGKNIEEEVK